MRLSLRHALALLAWMTTVAASTLPRDASAQTTHVVAQGHTLAKIARRYNVTVEALREANNLKVGEHLRPGMRLVIPDESAPPTARPASKTANADRTAPLHSHGPETTHLVAAGQTLARIARRYHCSVDALQDSNGLAPGSRLRPGTCLIVPLPPDAQPIAPERRPCTPSPDSRPYAKSYASRPAHPGVVHLVRGAISWSGRLTDGHARPLPAARLHLDRVLVSDSTGETHPTDMRLMPLLTMVSDHFGGRTIHVVSGYRPPTTNRYSEHSHHNNGEAIDFYVEGIPNDVLRDYCHSFTRVGVGYYPNSSFVHLDVRNATTHWVDESGPGEAPIYSSVSGSNERSAGAHPSTRHLGSSGRRQPDPDTDPDSE